MDTSCHVWLDAICINQADVVEKKQQIDRMPEVYRRSAHVVIWLGPCGGQPHDDKEECSIHFSHRHRSSQELSDELLFQGSAPGTDIPLVVEREPRILLWWYRSWTVSWTRQSSQKRITINRAAGTRGCPRSRNTSLSRRAPLQLGCGRDSGT